MSRPFVFGFTVYKSFEYVSVWDTGIIPVPQRDEPILGGHAVVACGYDNQKGVLIRNSWGTQWGMSGYGWMPWEYFTMGICDDLWTINLVEKGL